MIPAVPLLISLLKICFVKYFFIQSLPLHISCIFSIFLNDDVLDIEKPDGICLPTFPMNEFSELPLHPSIFFIKH